MKLRRILIENVRSFLEPQELRIPAEIAILIGPNGGGKTNLLDTAVTALRLHLLKSWVARHNPTIEWNDRYDWINNDSINSQTLEKHSLGADRQQRIELDIEVTQRDVENIQKAKAEAAEIAKQARRRYTSNPAGAASEWLADQLKAGDSFTYVILDNNRQPASGPAAETFLNYLETYEINSRLRSELERTALSTPMISLPVTRSAGGLNESVALADFNEFDHKRTVDAASSRSTGSIFSLAIGRLAERFRNLLEMDNGKAREMFDSEPGVVSFTKTLKLLGYDWELQCTDTKRNRYDICLKKQGTSFFVGSASSGERELLIYLFAIYALNVRDALIVIDEPELHLHPRWQKTLLNLFERLSAETGNQFIMATHSPVFISPASIQYVSRVSSENRSSKVVRLGDSSLPEAKHLFGIVNSQNNEKLFFCDKVVLVEGATDRIFFETLLKCFGVEDQTATVYEVISVGGKTFFDPYRQLLTACGIPFSVIADLDYVSDIGTDDLKSLFSIKSKDVKEKVVDDLASIDGQNLVARMDEALRTKDFSDLERLWEYIKGRQRRLKETMSEVEKDALNAFIDERKKKNVFILSAGALEAYLPIGCRAKNMDKLIRLTSSTDFWDQLPAERRGELESIVKSL